MNERSSTDSSPVILHEPGSQYMQGRKALAAWKKGRGSSKTWRQCERIKISDSKMLVIMKHGNQCFYTPLLWLPQAFIRSPTPQRCFDTKRTLVSRSRVRRPGKHSELSTRYPEEYELCHQPKQSRESTSRTQEQGLPGSTDTEVPAAYMRLTWGYREIPIGQLDRFVPEGFIFLSRWRILSFLRNDTHADIYAVTNLYDRLVSSTGLELHHFLAEYHGNSATYAKRRQERMYNGGYCMARFWYGDRRMLVVQVPRPKTSFRINSKDFPALRGSVSRSVRQTRCPYRLSNMPTYAAVLRTPRGVPQLPPLHQRLEEEKTRRTEEIREKTREKRSRKQRDKRNAQRLAMRQGRALENEESYVASGAYNLT